MISTDRSVFRAQVLLYETGTEVYIDLDEGRVANAAEAMDLAGLDYENVTRARFEFDAVDGPEAAAFPYELDLIVRMTVGSRATPGKSTEQEYGDIDVPIIGANEVVRAALEGEVFLTDAVHSSDAPTRTG